MILKSHHYIKHIIGENKQLPGHLHQVPGSQAQQLSSQHLPPHSTTGQRMASISFTGKPVQFLIEELHVVAEEAGVLVGAEVFWASPQDGGLENRQAVLNVGSKAVLIWSSRYCPPCIPCNKVWYGRDNYGAWVHQ